MVVAAPRPAASAPGAAPRKAPPRVEFSRDLDYRDEITARADAVRWLVIPKRRYLMIEGTDLPGSEGFGAAIGTLYPVAYTMHFALKKRGVHAPIGALEGLYWIGAPGPIPARDFTAGPDNRPRWTWRLMLPLPAEATADDFRAARDAVAAKTTKRPPLLDQLRCQLWEEGRVVQLMHIGPYEAEAPTIERLHAAIDEAGMGLRGCHHEIYISNPSATAPERMKTLIRQPVDLEPVDPQPLDVHPVDVHPVHMNR